MPMLSETPLEADSGKPEIALHLGQQLDQIALVNEITARGIDDHRATCTHFGHLPHRISLRLWQYHLAFVQLSYRIDASRDVVAF